MHNGIQWKKYFSMHGKKKIVAYFTSSQTPKASGKASSSRYPIKDEDRFIQLEKKAQFLEKKIKKLGTFIGEESHLVSSSPRSSL